MPRSVIRRGQVVTPETGFKLFVNNVEYTEYALNYEFIREANNLSTFKIDFVGIDSSEKTDVAKGNIVRFESKNKLLFKGEMERVEYSTDLSATVNGFDAGENALQKGTAKNTSSSSSDSDFDRPIYEDVTASTVLSEQVANVSSVTIDPVDDGTDLGTGSFRTDHGSVISLVDGVAASKGGQWWVTHGTRSPWSANILHVKQTRGSLSSVATYRTSGSTQNASVVSNEVDKEHTWNSITVLGYGDGKNQLRSTIYNATDNRSKLSQDIGKADTIIPVEDASVFDATGTVWIGMEQVAYTGKSGNTLTGATRSVEDASDSNSQDYLNAYAHGKGVAVWDAQYAENSTDGNSAIDSLGEVRTKTIQDKTVMGQDTLDRIAIELLNEHETLVQRISVVPSDPYDAARTVDIGDTVTIIDANSDLDGDFAVHKIKMFSESGYEQINFECSNGKVGRLTFTRDLEQVNTKTEAQTRYMQGATNAFLVSNRENCDADQPLEMLFYIPDDVVRVNKALLNFKVKAYRAYTADIDTESSHTHNFQHNHQIFTGGSSGSSPSSWQSFQGYASNGTGNSGSFTVGDNSDTDIYSKNQNGSATTTTGTAHNHGRAYSITLSGAGATSLTVEVGDDSDFDNTKAEVLGSPFGSISGATSVSILSGVVATGVDKWVRVQFTPNDITRVEADVFVKFFLNSI